MKRYFVTGGAGFIGANIVRRLLALDAAMVTIFDNFSSGKRHHAAALARDSRVKIVEGDARNLGALNAAIPGHDVVFHLAANSNIAKAANEPLIDFEDGTLLTQNVLEAMRTNRIKRIFFTSGSGVYGDVPPERIPEDYPLLRPISTYGASKLASEVLICAYSYMFDMKGTVTRFANVVGPLMTHGVTHDFLRRLAADPQHLTILGDGNQTKPYVHVDDIIDALFLLMAKQEASFDCFNVGTEDNLTVRRIADLVVDVMGLKGVAYDFTGGSRGWRADVPNYQLNTDRIRSVGWTNKMGSRDAVESAARSMLEELRQEQLAK